MCTASRVCLDDSTHVETESQNSIYTVVIPATCEHQGKAEYKVNFTNPSFVSQIHDVVLEKKEHNFHLLMILNSLLLVLIDL